MSDSGRSSSQLLASLQARKETLEAKLNDKTQELKLLCIKEAELTGVLPPEIPLEPGESPPQFRRRVGTAFTYPENLLNNNNVKTKEEETLATLELEYKIQKDIADAALGMANDSSLSKAVRRKHRQVYQKIQRRLADLDAKLHHLQENLGHSGKPQQFKQRKKPRPPLENEADGQEQDPILHEEGISLSPVGPLRSPIEGDNMNHRYVDVGRHVHHNANIQLLPSGMWHSASFNGLSLPANQENKTTYHRHPPMAYHHHHLHRQYPNLHYATLPSGADLGYMVQRERLDQGCSLPGYWLRYETDLENLTYSALSRPHQMPPMYQTAVESYNRREMKDPLPVIQDTVPPPSVQNKIQAEKERYGSLDRGYNRTSHSNSNPCLEVYGTDDISVQMQNMPPITANANYYSTLPSYCGVDPGRLYQTPQNYVQNNCNVENRSRDGGALLPNQTYPEHSLGVNNMGLTRTQSLGSVETSVSNVQVFNVVGSDNRSVKDHQRTAPSDTLIRKQKEKEWYETSLDSTPASVIPAPVQRSCPPSRRPSGHSLNEVKMSAIHSVNDTGTSSKLSMHNQKSDVVNTELVINDRSSDVSSELSRSSSNVSNEQHSNYHTLQAKCHEMVSSENFDTVVPFESPKNHMVVQAGKWQPYREVTKPFEMADFYKYSTKFRKNAGISQTGQSSGHCSGLISGNVSGHSVPHHSINEDVSHLLVQSNSNSVPQRTCPNTNSPTPQQKGIYQPLLPMTCQPVDPDDGSVGPSKNRLLGPESLDGKRLGNSKSLADAFSTEMLEWYQDQSVPRSATLV